MNNCKVIRRTPVFLDCQGDGTPADNIDLGYIASEYNGVITNSVGNDAIIPTVNSERAGLMTPSMLSVLQSSVKVIPITNYTDGSTINHNLNGTVLIQFVDNMQVMGGFYAEYMNNNNSIFRTPVSGTFTGYLICIKLF